ncbi:hypothetical protein [Persephonella sp.]
MEICGLIFPEKCLKKHLDKRIKEGVIESIEEYISKIKETIKNAEKVYLVRQFSDCKDKLVFYFNSWSVWVLVEENRIITAFFVREHSMENFFDKRKIKNGLKDDCEEESYEEVKDNENHRYTGFIKAVQNRC